MRSSSRSPVIKRDRSRSRSPVIKRERNRSRSPLVKQSRSPIRNGVDQRSQIRGGHQDERSAGEAGRLHRHHRQGEGQMPDIFERWVHLVFLV